MRIRSGQTQTTELVSSLQGPKATGFKARRRPPPNGLDLGALGQGLSKYKRPSSTQRVHHPSNFSQPTKLAPLSMKGIAEVWQADRGSKLLGEIHRAVTGELRLPGVEVCAALRSPNEAGRFFLHYADGSRDTLLFTRDPEDSTRICATLHSGDGSGIRAQDRLKKLGLTPSTHGVCTDRRAIASVLSCIEPTDPTRDLTPAKRVAPVFVPPHPEVAGALKVDVGSELHEELVHALGEAERGGWSVELEGRKLHYETVRSFLPGDRQARGFVWTSPPFERNEALRAALETRFGGSVSAQPMTAMDRMLGRNGAFVDRLGDPLRDPVGLLDEATLRALASQGAITAAGRDGALELWEMLMPGTEGSKGLLALRDGAGFGELYFPTAARADAERWVRDSFQREEI